MHDFFFLTNIKIKMTYRLCVAIVFWYNLFVANTHAQVSLIKNQSINATTLIGETIEFNCLEFVGSQKSTSLNFKWYKNGSPFYDVEKKYYKRVKLDKSGEILKIYNVEIKDEGDYVCELSYQHQYTYSRFTLTVKDLPNVKTHEIISSNEIRHVGSKTIWFCFELQGTDYNIDQYTWYKNGEPLHVAESNSRILLEYENQKLTYRNLTLEDNGTYECRASNKFRIDYSVYTLIVSESSKINYYQANVTRHIGETMKWSCSIPDIHTNENNFHYTWYKNDKNLQISKNDIHMILSEDNASLSINGITFDDAGNYECFEKNRSVMSYSKINLIVVDRPKKLLYRWYTSNIISLIGVTLQLRCNILQSTKYYKTLFSWKKNGKPLILDDNNKKLNLVNNNATLLLLDITLDEKGTYECEGENDYHKIYSHYTLNIVVIPEVNNLSSSNTSSLQRPITNFPLLNSSVPHQVQISDKDSKDLTNSKQINSILNYLIFISVLTVSGIIMICYVMSLRREKVLKRKLKEHKLKFLNGDLQKWNPDLSLEEQTDLLPYDKEWEFPKNKLKLGIQLGSGAFGVVFKADAIGINGNTNSTTVAVKMVKPNSDPSHIKALISELKIMIHIGKHLNIVNVLGACTEDISNDLMVIVEYCRYGSIREYLLKQRNIFINQVTPDGLLKYDKKTIFKFPSYQNYTNEINSLELSEDNNPQDETSENNVLLDEDEAAWCSNYHGDYSNESVPPLRTHDLICWSFQIARGMEYLSSKKVLHGDLAIRNILIANNNVVKICDFGLAKTLHNYDIYKMSNKVPLPVKWMAIESLRDQVFSTRSDVWSFGIVLWELFSLAEIPYPNVKSFNDLYDLLVSGYRMKQPKHANHQIYDIMYDCWKMDPNSRPSFTDLTERISDLLQDDSKWFYVNLNEEYIRINSNKKHSIIDYENVFSPIRSTTLVGNSDSCPENSNQSEINDNVEMKSMVHNQN